jgi:dihydrofolate reductase
MVTALDQIRIWRTRSASAARLGGGVGTNRQHIRAGLIDEMHLAISPVLLGSGEHLFEGIRLPKLGYQCNRHVASANALHIVLEKGR